MIREVAGDLLESKAEAIAHGIAPRTITSTRGWHCRLRENVAAMGAGLQALFASEHPKPGESGRGSGA